MNNILNNKPYKCEVLLSNYNYWDLQLISKSFDNYCCIGEAEDELVAQIFFNSSGEVCSEVVWENSVSNAGDICDIGLTGIDNRYVTELTGVTINLDDKLGFCMNPISGDTFCYGYSVVSGETISYTSLCGSFYQGFYKLEGYDYQVLPERYYKGWTAELWIRSGDTTGCTCDTKMLLNEYNPNNSGFVFYFGTRAENKFCNVFSGETGIDTCESKIPLAPQFTIEVTGGTDIMNPFLYYTESRICNPIEDIEKAVLLDCCDGLTDNALGVRITPDGKINLRIVTSTGECNTNFQFIEELVVKDYITSDPIITDNEWHQVVVRFEPDGNPNECSDSELTRGNISVFIDGYRKVFVKDLKEFNPYALNVHKDKQLAVPFNISVGGGTQGLLESVTFDGPDLGVVSSGYTVCFYSAVFNECTTLAGIVIDGITYEAPNLTVYEGDLICQFLSDLLPDRINKIDVNLKTVSGKDTLYITIPVLAKTKVPEALLLNDTVKTITCKINLDNCVDLPEHIGKCGLLEEYFAGTFIGDIYKFNFYNKSLYVQDIRCNYKKTLEILNV